MRLRLIKHAIKHTRPLVMLAWLDYKEHVGPLAGLNEAIPELRSGASSIYSAVSHMSNPFASLLGLAEEKHGQGDEVWLLCVKVRSCALSVARGRTNES